MEYTVLIFEDDVTVSRSLLINIDWNQFNVTKHLTADNVPDGRRLFQENTIHLVLCDIEVIGGTGLELLKWAREHEYDTEFVFLTNYAEFSYAQEAIKLGGNDYILKTEPMDVIESAVERSIMRIEHQNSRNQMNNDTDAKKFSEQKDFLNDDSFREISIEPNWKEWKWYILNSEKIKLLDDIKNYFYKAQMTMPIHSGFLALFHHDFIRMTNEILHDFDIQLSAQFDNEMLAELYNNATVSVFDMIKWLSRFIDRVIICLDEKKSCETIIEKAKSFIQENYTNDINRQNIASALSVNSDYLSRLFNKQIGVSIPEYISGLRIEHAKQLMITNMPVSNIAIEVGIVNFSYFSKIFKKYTGVSPTEYKKNLSE